MELTQEYFDKVMSAMFEQLTGVKADVTQLKSDMATRVATKNDLKAQTQELKDYVHQAFEAQQSWIDNRFDELIVKYDVRDRVLVLEKDVAELKLKHS